MVGSKTENAQWAKKKPVITSSGTCKTVTKRNSCCCSFDNRLLMCSEQVLQRVLDAYYDTNLDLQPERVMVGFFAHWVSVFKPKINFYKTM